LYRALIVIVVAAALAGAQAAISHAASDGASAGGPSPGLVRQGHTLYVQQCSRCHGFNMVNTGGPAFDLRTFPKNDRARFFRSVTNGKPPNMPPWGDVLAPSDIESLWAYVRTGGKL
jgi:cytochrome c55X